MNVGPLTLFERRVIGDGPTPLLVRYIVFRLPAFGVYLHKLCRSDYDRALHDHPWPFISVLLTDGYWERHDQTINCSEVEEWRPRWSVLLRPAEWRHRLVLEKAPVWTLILVGRRSRSWGFFLPGGWCWWRKTNYRKGICEDGIIWKGGKD